MYPVSCAVFFPRDRRKNNVYLDGPKQGNIHVKYCREKYCTLLQYRRMTNAGVISSSSILLFLKSYRVKCKYLWKAFNSGGNGNKFLFPFFSFDSKMFLTNGIIDLTFHIRYSNVLLYFAIAIIIILYWY